MTEAFSFLDHGSLPTPKVTLEQAQSLLHLFGIDGSVEELGSQQDANFRVRAEAGTFVLKISNPAFSLADLGAQEAAAQCVARSWPNIQVSVGVPDPEGKEILEVGLDGQRLLVRLLTFVDGEMLSRCNYLAPSTVAAVGELAGRTAKALQSLDTPVPDRILQWDLRYAAEVVERLADFVAPPGGTESVQRATQRATQVLAQHRGHLRVQAIHGDLPDNIIARRDASGRLQPVGVIDFGDLMSSWMVAELAVACASLLYYAEGNPAVVLPAVSAFDRVYPLEDHEVEALWPLIVLRAATLMVSGQHQASIDPSNAYATGNLGREWRIFEQAISIPIEVGTNLVKSVLRPPDEVPHPELPSHVLLGPLPVFELDVSTESPYLDAGRFLDPEVELHLAWEALARCNGSAVGYIPFLQPRLTRTRQNCPGVPETVPLGMELFVRERVSVRAPWDGMVDVVDDAVALRGSNGLTLWLSGDVSGVNSGQRLAEGTTFAEVVPAEPAQLAVLRVQLTSLAQRPPFWIQPAMAAAWSTVCIDPMYVLGSASSRRDSAASRSERLLGRRASAFATVQEHYFDGPPQIERGWKNHLFDVDGRSYLDMLNNVSILGHGHPRLADAIESQWRRLNTNSRFHYGALVELSERVTALMPAELDTVFLVNSGTEAVDLALRLAWANTGRRDIVALREAYHGWSYATDAVSTSVADNPNALSTRPSWVHTVSAPNEYRGQYRNSETHRYAQDAVASIRSMADEGRPPAAFLSESFYGNAGGMALPDGYLSAVYEATREAGGLCIADEVQVGYGRLGEHFWGFEQQGATPDIITIAKSMGNGHPLGAVVTTKAIADTYRSQGYFFSSAGGSPVSCRAGIAVLDILQDEQLQENARTVGRHLKSRLLALAEHHQLIGAVHGMGLYLGVELVRDRMTLEPATEETAAICERLRELGIIMQPTSDRMCVLKIKPPLGVTLEDVDYFADTLDRVLSEGW